VPRRFGLTAAELRQVDEVSVGTGLRLALLAAARSSPGEVCAALYGSAEGPLLTLTASRPLPNADPGACFTISVADLLTGAGAAGARPRLLGLFHSHPDSAPVPSELDGLAMARLPFVWAIASRCGEPAGALRFYAWSTGGVRELRPRRHTCTACSPSRCRWCVIQATSSRAPSSAESSPVMSLLRSVHRPERRSS
jgi:desampylase